MAGRTAGEGVFEGLLSRLSGADFPLEGTRSRFQGLAISMHRNVLVFAAERSILERADDSTWIHDSCAY
jgi:hypothetical protein